MAKNPPTGDNRRVGAVRGRSRPKCVVGIGVKRDNKDASWM